MFKFYHFKYLHFFLSAILLLQFLGFETSAQNEPNLTDGLVLHYNFNNNIKDISGNGNNIRNTNLTYASNINGSEAGSVNLQGKLIKAYLKKPNYSKDYSVSFWFKANYNLNNTIKSKIKIIDFPNSANGNNNCFSIYYLNESLFIDVDYLDKKNTVVPFSDGFKVNFQKDKWYFITYTFGEISPLTITINDHTTEIGTMDNLVLKLKNLNNPLVIGGDASTTDEKEEKGQINNNFSGLLDDLRIYNRILSEDEILKLYILKTEPEINESKKSEPEKPFTNKENSASSVPTFNDAPAEIIGNLFALVIGNSAYESAKLTNPVNDADSMTAALKALGFTVKTLKNGTRKTILEEVSNFSTALSQDKNTTGLFYYAGHGIQSKGHNYLIPVDADIKKEADIEVNCVDLNNIMAYLEEASNNMNMIILDACRNNPFGRSFRSSVGSGLATVARQPKGTFLAYATAPGTVAADGTGQNGLYTAELVKALKIPNLKIEDVFKRVRYNVSKQSNDTQIPWDNSSLVGDFYFKIKKP